MYSFIQGTGGHDLNYGGGTLTSSGVFQATQTTGTISSGAATDYVYGAGEVAHWRLNENQGFIAHDETSNSNDLTQATIANQPAIITDLSLKRWTDPIFYEDFSSGRLGDNWVPISGSYEIIYDSTINMWCIRCITAGQIRVILPQQISDLTKANWRFTCKLNKDADINNSWIHFICNGFLVGSAGYKVGFDSDEKVVLNEVGGANLTETAAAAITIQTWYDLRVDHTAAALFTTYLDDVAVVAAVGANPVMDASIQNIKSLLLDFDAGDTGSNFRWERY